MGYIYYIKNKINDKYYIGQTKRDYLKRINEHFQIQVLLKVYLLFI